MQNNNIHSGWGKKYGKGQVKRQENFSENSGCLCYKFSKAKKGTCNDFRAEIPLRKSKIKSKSTVNCFGHELI